MNSSGDVEEMEVDEDGDLSSAPVVDKEDLHILSIPYDDDDARSVTSNSRSPEKSQRGRNISLRFLEPRSRPKRKSESSSNEPRQSTSKSALIEEEAPPDPKEEIRRATDRYLNGNLNIDDFETLMGVFEKYNQQYEAQEEPQAHHPSLILLKPEMVSDVDVKHVPEVILHEGDHDPAMAKLRGEFFRTGDDLATFSVRRKKKMPPTIKNMMGEAHVRFARGDLTGAESICLEIIKQQPTYNDPFHTLAMIYENQGKLKKSLQFSIISGLLDPKKFGDWPRIAELSVKEGKLPQAIWCLTKAITQDSSNVKAILRRSELLSETGDLKGALRGYNKVLSLPDTEGDVYMNVAKGVAGIHFKNNDLDLAYEALSNAVNKFPEIVTTAELNLLVEVCISLKRYVKAITLFIRFSGVKFEPSVSKSCYKEKRTLINSLSDKEVKRKCHVPIGLHADLVQKLSIVLIHLEAFDMVLPIVNKLKDSETLDTFGIQFYEIAEAYLAKQQFDASLAILKELINTDKYKMAEIWLRYAECLFLLNRFEESAEAYSKVIQLAPGHKIARLNLSVILQKLGKFDIALESLAQSDMEDLIDQDLLVEKCNILLSRGRITEFYDTAMQLFSRHCPEIRSHDEAHALVITSQTNQMLQGLRAIRIRKGDPDDSDIPAADEQSSESPLGEWTVYLNLLRTLLKINRIDLFSRVAYTVWSSPVFNEDSGMKQDMDLHVTLAAILNSDYDLAPLLIRVLLCTYGQSSIILSLISLACRRCGHTRFGRQIIRRLMKSPNDTRLMMMSAHNSFMNGTYKYALMEYLALYKLTPHEPIIPLMIATTLLHIASQKHTNNRSQLMMQAVAFVNKYAELRGDCQETYYNLGRFYHYLGIFRTAMEYYKKVLNTDPVDDQTHSDYNISDLKREAAFNIAQIYKACDCWQMAKQYVHRYVVI